MLPVLNVRSAPCSAVERTNSCLPPVARQAPGEQQAHSQGQHLPEERRLPNIPPQFEQQGKDDLFVHFRSITAP
jgi:hypothetical protein